MQLQINFEHVVTEQRHVLPSEAQKKPYVAPKPDNKAIVDKLLKHAQSLLNQAEKINTEVSGNWTYRRQQFANSAQKKKDKLIKNATAIERLADLWKENECPDILKHVRHANDFDVYFPKPPDKDHGDWYHEAYPAKLKKATRLGITSQEKEDEFNEAVKELSEIILSEEEENLRKLITALTELRSTKMPGFYPTPDKLIETMIEHADIRYDDVILEPSAGIGSIADVLISNGHPKDQIFLVEVNYKLREILSLKRYVPSGDDIFEYNPGRKFDKILMNPPFEKKQDIKHVMHCYNKYLNNDGKLVAVMSAGTQSNSDALSKEFMELVGTYGYVVELGQQFNSADAFRNTGTSTILVILER